MILAKFPLLPLSVVCGLAAAAAQDTSLVRESGPLSPDEERAALKVPDGFTVQLFAAEPMINKPMNMNFDRRGRLWVSSTVEYPFPGAQDRWSDPQGTRLRDSRDAIRILEDTDGDGAADKVTVFADELNVPNGVLPWGNGCIAWSIPNIWYFQDTDGDGVCDRREILFGPLGYDKDTHGNISSLTAGLDGWIYATHGFNNTSRFAVRPEKLGSRQPGDPGTALELTSGNVFRFRPDGSEIEIWSHGQVNPFGLARDAMGSLYSADCHSNPISHLIRGGWYPSFGRPHDGLGFAPVMCAHAHGSTGLCGILYLDRGVWGPEWDDHMFVGNCVTSRVNHDTVTWNGATPTAVEQPDFVVSDDPWFRPVNLHLGPDGALYIADFYNKIIGHYEVDLHHPGRDRERGRIWRVVRTGMTGRLPDENLTTKSADELADRLGDPNLTRRCFAVEELVARGFRPYVPADGRDSSLWRSMAAWVRHRLRAENPDPAAAATDAIALRQTGDPLATIHALAMRTEDAPDPLPPAWLDLLSPDTPPRVSLAAAQAIAYAGNPGGQGMIPFAEATIRRLESDPDELLAHVLTRALHRILGRPGVLAALPPLDDAADNIVAPLVRRLPGRDAAAWTLARLTRKPESAATLTDVLPAIVQHFSADDETALVALLRDRFRDDAPAQEQLVIALARGIASRGTPAAPATAAWASDIAERLLARLHDLPGDSWTALNTERSPWAMDERECQDGKSMHCIGSLPAPRGPALESLTGTLRSRTFAAPATLSFWICGHSGPPGANAHERNHVRLVDPESGSELRHALPPRDDRAHLVKWDLADLSGREVALELVDGDAGDAWAWLAVGRIEPPVVPVDLHPRDGIATALAQVNAVAALPEADRVLLGSVLSGDGIGDAAAVEVSRSLVSRAPTPDVRVVLQLAQFPGTLPFLREPGAVENGSIRPLLLQHLPARLQDGVAQALCESRESAARLVDWAADGQAPAALLRQPAVAQRIAALNDPALAARAEALTKNLPPLSEETAALVADRLAAWREASARGIDTSRGPEIFAAHCAVCHRIGDTGNLVGPQLDGIGNRGAERLVEDILDPNRNVDVSFRTHVLTLKSGEVKAGLVRRREGASLVLADATGQESAVPAADIATDEESPLSLMPPTLHLTIPEDDLLILTSWLLKQ